MLEQLKNTIKKTTDVYLNKFLPKIPEDKKSSAIASYEADIEKIADYISNTGFLNADFQLTEDFLKWFHKSLYPEGFIQKQKDEKWKEVIWMIPGEYKHIKIISKDWDLCRDLPNWTPNYELYTLPENTKKEIGALIDDFNGKIDTITDLNKKKDCVLFFVFKYTYIHPFSDWNGRLVMILSDLFCLKFGMIPLHFMRLRELDRQWLHKAIFMSHTQKNLKYIYDFIGKYSK